MPSVLLHTKLRCPSLPARRVDRPQLVARLAEGFASGRQITLVSAPAGFGKTTCIVEWLTTKAEGGGRKDEGGRAKAEGGGTKDRRSPSGDEGGRTDDPFQRMKDRRPPPGDEESRDSGLFHPLKGTFGPSAFILPPSSVSWLSLDPSDNDPARFFSYLIAALRKVDESIGKEIEPALRSGQLPPMENIGASLINDLLQLAHPFLLVLDDFHVLQNRTILELFENLATHLPPSLFLVLLTREDPSLPLARLRANNQVSEIRAADLRFTRDEAGAFLNEVMGLGLAPEDIASLANRTEGWVVGLQLAALSLKNRADRGEFIARLSGSQHYILSYLTEEVLRRQSPEIQDFLLETSVLDRLSGSLCNAVTERVDGAAVLEQLYASNVFVLPLDEEHAWYRYHHLFADLLRHQLKRARPERESVLHLRASAWFESQSSPLEAIEHAFAAQDYARAAHLLDRQARWALMQGYAATLEHWLHQLPPEWRVVSPQSNLAIVGSFLLRGRLGEVEPYLQNAEAAAAERARAGASAEAGRILCEARASRAIYDSIRGETKRGIALAQEAVELAPRDDPYLQGMALFALGGAYHYDAQILPAIDAYQRALPLCQASGNNVASMLTIANLGLLYLLQGKLRAAADLCIQAIQAAEQTPGARPPALASVYTNYGAILYEWGDLAAIHRLMDEWFEVTRQGGHISTMAHDGIVMARLRQAEGDNAGAQVALDDAMQMIRGSPDWVGYRAVSLQVHLALARDDDRAAEQALAETGLAADDPIDNKREPLHIAYLRLLHHRGAKDPQGPDLDQALDLAHRLLASAEPDGRMGRVIEILALRALVYQARGDLTRAVDDLCRALALAEPEGYLRLFVDEGEPMRLLLSDLGSRTERRGLAEYAKRLLAAFSKGEGGTRKDEKGQDSVQPSAFIPQRGPSAPHPLLDPLTDRELEVLRLIAEGLSYREIAERLVVSLNTVRFHVKGIYGKLGVENRAAAVAQARTLGLPL